MPDIDQYVHGAAILIVSPDGTISRYLPGVRYPAKQFKLAMLAASEGKTGSVFDQILMMCYAYNPDSGKFELAMSIMQIGGGITLVLLGGAFWTIQYVLNLPTAASDPPATRTLSIATSPPGATVFIDGDSVGQAPLEHPVSGDSLGLRARMAGFFPVDTTLAVPSDQQLSLTLAPVSLAANASEEDESPPTSEVSSPAPSDEASDNPTASEDTAQDASPTDDDPPETASDEASPPPSNEPPPEPGVLTLTSTPDSATVMLNGTLIGATPLTLDTLSGNTYRLAFRKDQRQEFTTTVAVQPGQTTRVDATLPPRPAVLTLRIIPYGDILIDDSLRAERIETAFVDTLAPGLHRVTARYRSMEWTKTLSLLPGQSQQQTVDFTETVAVPITAQTEDGAPLPNAEIVVDSTAQGYTPQQLQLRIGRHTIIVRKDGFVPEERTINVDRTTQDPLVFQLRRRS